ncbi:MAG: hypothetical protein BYD32DRAFT_77114 [Podila humilis]|nr:MAG: hypothetical protein BYD32DRAFT_77114 [Podila humilis]
MPFRFKENPSRIDEHLTSLLAPSLFSSHTRTLLPHIHTRTYTMLHKHVDTEEMIRHAKLIPLRHRFTKTHSMHSLAYGSRYATDDIPKYKLPEKSVEAQAAYQLIHDELELDGRPAMNLASFGAFLAWR